MGTYINFEMIIKITKPDGLNEKSLNEFRKL